MNVPNMYLKVKKILFSHYVLVFKRIKPLKKSTFLSFYLSFSFATEKILKLCSAVA